jgi:hypothetical protein
LTFRDATSLLVRRPRRPLSRRSLQRPCLRVTGPLVPPASSRTRTDRRAPLMRLRLLPFGVRWSRRTARSNQLRAIPLRRCSQPRHPRQEVGSPVRILAPRVSGAFQLRASETPPRGSFVADFFRAYVPDPRRLLSRPDRDRQSPGDAHGIHYRPSQFCFRPRVTASFDVSHPPAVSPLTAASFIVAGSTACDGGPSSLWPRLLGFGPASEPCRVICRPRYSFYA